MGEMADMIIEDFSFDYWAGNLHEINEEFRTMYNAGIWRTKDGSEIVIRKMTDRHIINCMRKIERDLNDGCQTSTQEHWAIKYLMKFRLELKVRDMKRPYKGWRVG